MDTCDDRSYGDVAWLEARWIMLGFAWARLSDGRAAGIQRQDDGMWQAYLRGEKEHTPQRTWEEAKDALEHKLAGEGIWLRVRG